LKLGVIVLLFLMSPALAGLPVASKQPPVEVTVYTDPPGAQVFHVMSSKEPDFLGLSNQVMRVDGRLWRNARGDWMNGTLLIRLEGYKEMTVPVSPDMFRKHRWPLTGSLSLEAESGFVAARDWLWRYRVWITAALLALLAGAMFHWRRERTRKKAMARADALEGYRASARDDRWIGSTVLGYRLTKRLGAGGMALVYLGVPDATLDERDAVAVKILKVENKQDSGEFHERFRREVKASQKMDHPHIVRLVDWSVEDPCCIVMEFLEGRTLREKLRPDRGVSRARALSWIRPLFSAVDYAHREGIMHRDLKPENVIVTSAGLLKVLDFGLARGHQVTVELTATGTCIGTPASMAPEQISGRPSMASDQYALGMMAYEMLGGSLPFDDGDVMTVLLAHVQSEPRPLSALDPSLRDVEPVIMRMIAKNPRQRYATVGHALSALERVLS
jgi:hypothetical protein